ncbi:MAG TPA: ABC transporter permease subunit [Actinomycetota bacterium]|nr:ABC transporter permease subunit [Actinomycetota bacterium]
MGTPTVTEIPEGESTTAVRLDATRRTPSIRWKATAYSLLGAATALLVWQLASGFQRTEFNLLPSPAAVLDQMGAYTFGDEAQGIPAGFVFVNFWDTLRKTLIGFAGAVVIGVPIGILMGRYRYAKNFFFDFVYLAANVPLIVYAILGLLLFGIGDAGPAFVVMLLVLPVISLNVAAGVEGVDRNLLSMSRAYGMPTSAAMRDIVIPSFAPFLFASARASFAASWKLAALAETFGGTTGVGVQIRKAFQGFSVTDMLAWMMFFVLFVVLIERVVLMRLERFVFRYRLKRGEDVLRY